MVHDIPGTAHAHFKTGVRVPAGFAVVMQVSVARDIIRGEVMRKDMLHVPCRVSIVQRGGGIKAELVDNWVG